MYLGAVVVSREDQQRGQVVYWKGYGNRAVRIFADDEYSVKLGPGTYRAGTNVGGWDLVPSPEWTAQERVQYVALTHPEGDTGNENDELGFHLVAALFDPQTYEAVLGDDAAAWPVSYHELVARVAEWIDGELGPVLSLAREWVALLRETDALRSDDTTPSDEYAARAGTLAVRERALRSRFLEAFPDTDTEEEQ